MKSKRVLRTTHVCRQCQSRHIKCDGTRPCGNCRRAAVDCLPVLKTFDKTKRSPSQRSTGKTSVSLASARDATIVAPPNLFSRTGNKTFYQFSLHVVKYWPNFMRGRYFWMDALLPAYQSEAVVQHGLDCMLLVEHLPLTETTKLALPVWAIEAYSQSLSKPPDDISLILLTANIYIKIESRLLHYKNVDSLLRSTFALIQSHHEIILAYHLKNSALYGIIFEMLDCAIVSTGNPRCISRDHWETTVALVLRMAAEQDLVTKAFLYMIEIYNIRYDIANGDFSDIGISTRLNTVYQDILKQEARTDLKPLERQPLMPIRALILEAQVVWYFGRWRLYQDILDGDLFKVYVEAYLKRIESLSVLNHESLFVSHLDKMFIRACILIAWYWREPLTGPRLGMILERFRSQVLHVDRIIAYVDTLVSIEHGVVTNPEKEVFGSNQPQVLDRWQLWRLSDYFAADIPPSTSMQTVASQRLIA